MEQQNRKKNRLSEYDYGQEGHYFITLCTHNRACLFEMEMPVGNGLCAVPDHRDLDGGTPHRAFPTVENQIVHKWMKEINKKFPNVAVDKYVIMPDHLHFIVTIKERHTGRSLQDIVQFFKTMTTNEYIRCVKLGLVHRFDKKVWQKSYYDHIIRNQQDYNDVWEYIHYNPTKWMLIHNLDM